MGEAKRRGTREERITQAEAIRENTRKRAEQIKQAEKAEAEFMNKLPPEERVCPQCLNGEPHEHKRP